MTNPQTGFFLSKERLEELREQGIIAISPTASRLWRCGFVLLAVGLVSWGAGATHAFESDRLLAATSSREDLLAAGTVAVVVALLVLGLGLLTTRGYLALPGSEKMDSHRDERPSPWGPRGAHANPSVFAQIVGFLSTLAAATAASVLAIMLGLSLISMHPIMNHSGVGMLGVTAPVGLTGDRLALEVLTLLQTLSVRAGALLLIAALIWNLGAVLAFHASNRR